jgi:predicted PhzF superfamily epimerase YddE/YHI9
VTWRIPPRVALSGVDAFTDRPFGGNPAMVCPLPGPPATGGCSGPLLS